MTAKTKSEIRKLQAEVAALRPASAPGVATSWTSRGVARRAVRRTGLNAATLRDSVPRYG